MTATIIPAKIALLEALIAYQENLLTGELARQQLTTLSENLAEVAPPLIAEQRDRLLEGNWQLLYTNKSSFSPLESLPGIKLGRVFQAISPAENLIFNLAELQVSDLFTGIFAVQARFAPLSPTRVSVKFERTFLTTAQLLTGSSVTDWIAQLKDGERLPGLSLGNLPGQEGWLEIRYVDETLRIGIGNRGNLFILTRVADNGLAYL